MDISACRWCIYSHNCGT